MSDLKELSQSQVPLERVAPLNSNRLVTFVNHFIVSIVQQLNELSAVVDSRLYDINNQILRCNANLVILEMKLNSISGLSSVSSVVTTDNQNVNQLNSNSLPQTTQNIDSNGVEELPQNEVIIDSAKSETSNEITKLKDNELKEEEETEEQESEPEDPRIAKYKKMVQLGIPLQAVHQKMRLEGVDTHLLS